MQVDHRVAQLLCSRFCHDLVGPLGAVSNGIELLDEGMDDEGRALGLIAMSAGQANRRLAFFRVAFGLSSGATGAASLSEARELAAGLLDGGKVTLDWSDAFSGVGNPVRPLAVKVLLNMVLIASESLPRGGTVNLHLADFDDGLGAAVTATGQDARLGDDLVGALAETAGAEDLTARNVHAYFAQCLAQDMGVRIEHSVGENGEIRLAVLFPAATDC